MLGTIVVLIALVGLFKLFVWWLSKYPRIARIFTIVVSGVGGAAIAGLAAAVFEYSNYGVQGGGQLLGTDRVAFIILTSIVAGFIIGAVLTFALPTLTGETKLTNRPS